jgi:hypothetical protein
MPSPCSSPCPQLDARREAWRYTEDVPAKLVRSLDEMLAAMEASPAPTPDDVCVAADGTRLDTPEKVRAWIDDVNVARLAAQAQGAEIG